MKKYGYPRKLSFRSVLDEMPYSTNPGGLNPGISVLLHSVKVSMPARNVLQVDYLEGIEKVNVCGIKGRLGVIVEVIGSKEGGGLRTCLSPHVPRAIAELFRDARDDSGIRTDTPGRVTITYPI